ncbi:MAG: flagellar hook-basal body complex protein FliE [Gammaproteobacteria bacterium]|nr:flagellar hook-basal body complex protein FliE [Gammaproteobacteria bacterium]
MDVQAVLSQMRAMREAAQGDLLRVMHEPDSGISPTAPKSEDFSVMLRSAIDSVNSTQNTAGTLQSAFVRGETRDLVSVMIATQKANVAFQGLLQTRNRLVSAYQEIMNMPI